MRETRWEDPSTSQIKSTTMKLMGSIIAWWINPEKLNNSDHNLQSTTEPELKKLSTPLSPDNKPSKSKTQESPVKTWDTLKSENWRDPLTCKTNPTTTKFPDYWSTTPENNKPLTTGEDKLLSMTEPESRNLLTPTSTDNVPTTRLNPDASRESLMTTPETLKEILDRVKLMNWEEVWKSNKSATTQPWAT